MEVALFTKLEHFNNIALIKIALQCAIFVIIHRQTGKSDHYNRIVDDKTNLIQEICIDRFGINLFCHDRNDKHFVI